MSTDESQQPSSNNAGDVQNHRRRRRTPPKWIWIVLATFGVLVAIARGTDVLKDHAIGNIVTWVLSFIGIVILAVWFMRSSGYSRLTRMLAFVGCVTVVASLVALFRIERVDGELSPTFVYRFSVKADRLLQAPAADKEKTKVDLRTTTENDFPGFLGPHRSDSLKSPKLARDWSKQPPQLIWRNKIGAGWSAFSVVNGHAVTMEQRGDMEMTTCYNVETGRLEWSHSTPGRYEKLEAGVGPRATPTIDQGMVYALGAFGRLTCLDGATGALVWEKDLFKEAGITPDDERASVPWGRSASPLVVGNSVIVPLGGKKGQRLVSLVAYDKQTGKLLWKGGESQISYASPQLATLAGTEQILIVNEDTAAGHDPKTGKLLWEHPWKGRSNADASASQAVPIAPNQVFLSKGYGVGSMLLQLNPKDDGTLATKDIWTNPRVLKTKFTNVATLDGSVYGLSDGILECADLATGRSQWKQGRYGHGQLLLVGDLLLVLSEQGEMVLIEATPSRANNVLGRFQAIQGLTWNNLALYGHYLLVRNAEEAACYKLP